MNKRKGIALILVLALFALMALGSGSPESGKSEAKPVAGVDNAQTEPASKAVTISETVILDQSGVKITAKELDEKGFFGPSLKLLIENNSSQNLTVQTRGSSVNGYMVETMLSADVASGKKANEELTLLRSELDEAGITTIADLEFSFHIFTTEGWNTYLDSSPVRLETSAFPGFQYTYDNSGETLFDNGEIQIVAKGLSEADSLFGPELKVYLHNAGNQNLCVQVREESVNGFMVDSLFSADVGPGKHKLDSITFLKSDLDANGITDIHDVELSFHIFNNDSWNVVADTPPVTLHFG